jgi:hypothetical protein
VRPASRSETKRPVSGMTCMIPRAPALETTVLLQPDSCQAIAFTNAGLQPCCRAVRSMRAPTSARVAVGAPAAAWTVRPSPGIWRRWPTRIRLRSVIPFALAMSMERTP